MVAAAAAAAESDKGGLAGRQADRSLWQLSATARERGAITPYLRPCSAYLLYSIRRYPPYPDPLPLPLPPSPLPPPLSPGRRTLNLAWSGGSRDTDGALALAGMQQQPLARAAHRTELQTRGTPGRGALGLLARQGVAGRGPRTGLPRTTEHITHSGTVEWPLQLCFELARKAGAVPWALSLDFNRGGGVWVHIRRKRISPPLSPPGGPLHRSPNVLASSCCVLRAEHAGGAPDADDTERPVVSASAVSCLC